jgi:hypothetical protein
MTGYSNGFKNVNVVHRWVLRMSAFEPLARPFGATLSPFRRVAFIGVTQSGACRAVAREAGAGESG